MVSLEVVFLEASSDTKDDSTKLSSDCVLYDAPSLLIAVSPSLMAQVPVDSTAILLVVTIATA